MFVWGIHRCVGTTCPGSWLIKSAAKGECCFFHFIMRLKHRNTERSTGWTRGERHSGEHQAKASFPLNTRHRATAAPHQHSALWELFPAVKVTWQGGRLLRYQAVHPALTQNTTRQILPIFQPLVTFTSTSGRMICTLCPRCWCVQRNAQRFGLALRKLSPQNKQFGRRDDYNAEVITSAEPHETITIKSFSCLLNSIICWVC